MYRMNPKQPQPQDPLQQPPVQPTTEPQQIITQNPFEVKEVSTSRNRRLTMIIVLVCFAVMALAGGGAYYLYKIMNTSVEAPREDDAPLKSSVFIDTVKGAVAREFPDTSALNVAREDTKAAPAYQLEGYAFGVQYDSNASFRYSIDSPSSSGANDVHDTLWRVVVDEFLAASLSAISSSEDIQASEKASRSAVYTGRNIVCAIHQEDTETQPEVGYVECGDIPEYERLSLELQPFADSIVGLPVGSVLSDLRVGDGEFGGYQHALLTVVSPGVVKQFAYFHKGDVGRWVHLTTNDQQVLPCTEFTSLNVQRAFSGVACRGAGDVMDVVKIVEKR